VDCAGLFILKAAYRLALLNRKQVVSLLVESTEGTAVTPIDSGGGFNTFNTSFAPDIEMYERDPFRASLGRLASIAGVKTATVGFETEMVASTAGNVGDPASSAADYPPFHNLMLASGYAAVLVDSYTITSLVGTFVAGETIEDDSGSEEAVCALTTKSGDTTLYVEAGGTVLSLGGTGATSEATASFSPQGEDVGILYKPSSTLPLVSYTVAVFNDGLRHRDPRVGQAEAWHAAIQDLVRVVDMAVAQQVDDRHVPYYRLRGARRGTLRWS